MPKITKHGGPTNALANPPEPTPVVPEVELSPKDDGGEDALLVGTNSSESSEKGEKRSPESVKKNPSPARGAASRSPQRRTGTAGSARSTAGRGTE